MSESTLIHGVPSEILLFFFRRAKAQLENYVYHPPSTSSESTSTSTSTSTRSSNDANADTPIPIKIHQQYILDEQMTVLNDIVKDYNRVKKTEITVQTVQNSLRVLGSSSSSSTVDGVTETENDGSDAMLKKAMKEMNDAARKAFCKSVLCSEYYWYKQQKEKQKEKHKHSQEQQQGLVEEEQRRHQKGWNQSVLDLMMLDYNKVERALIGESNNNDGDHNHDQEVAHLKRQLTLDFCGLCTTAYKLPEVQQYIQSGKEMNFLDVDDRTEDNDQDDQDDSTSTSSTHQRISHVQQMIICALGYEPYYSSQELIQKQMAAVDDNDIELKEAVNTFIVLLQEITRDALNYNMQEQKNTLTDEKEGGVTRVVAVNYSEREVTTGGGSASSSEAPMNQRMVEQHEEMQREQLQMAQKAAQLQRMILSELFEMEEEEREKCLLDAKKAHEGFLKDAMALPLTDRVAFMQNINPDLQKKLLMYKLWNATESR